MVRTPAGYVILIVAVVQFVLLTSTVVLLGWRLDVTRQGILRGEQEEASLLDLITTLEGDLYRVAVLSRDILILDGPEATTALDRSLQGLHQTLAPLRKQLPARLAGQFREMERDLEDYVNRATLLTKWSDAERRNSGPQYIASELGPRREGLRQSTDRLADLVKAVHDEGRQAKLGELDALRVSVYRLIGIVIILNLAVGAFAIVRIKGYEAERTKHLDRLAKVENRLRQLSQHQLELQEAERKRISRELHDETGQLLTALRIRIGQIETAGPAAQASADEAVAMAEQALRSIRELARGLRPTVLDDLGLVAALRSLARDLSRGTDLDISVEAAAEPAGLTEAQRTAVYRIVQEALTNCVKHAGASRVRIQLTGDTDDIMVHVEDDGVGLPATDSQGIGILGMQERATESGGWCRVTSRPGQRGTVVTTCLPRQAIQRTTA